MWREMGKKITHFSDVTNSLENVSGQTEYFWHEKKNTHKTEYALHCHEVKFDMFFIVPYPGIMEYL